MRTRSFALGLLLTSALMGRAAPGRAVGRPSVKPDWALKRLLRSLLGWREFDGRLQASGWAEKVPGKEWVGGSTLLVHEPTINVQRNKFRVERIRLGSSRFDLLANPTQIRATLDFDIDESTKVQGEALVQRHAGAPLDSTLTGRIKGRSEAIKVLPLLVPEIDRAAGRLDGNVVLGGTVGQPTFNGDFQVRDGLLELYRTNLKVTALQFMPRESRTPLAARNPR